MGSFLCWIWPYLVGGLLGWLAAGWLARRALSRAPATVERVVDRPVDRIVEKTVEVPVERVVEKVVDRPVDRVIEKVVEKIVEKPVDRVVEKRVEVPVDNPSLLAQIATLSATAAMVPQLQQRLAQAEATPAVAPDAAALEARDAEIAQWRQRHADLEARFQALSVGPAIDLAAARAAGISISREDELEVIEGIGPKIADLLRQAGIRRFWQLAQMSPGQIQPILDAAGPNYRLAVPQSWPEQAALAALNHWGALKRLQAELTAGIRK